MQPINRTDKRQPNVQIAASIRAAILSGELEPGAQLPAGHALATFFGVSRMTVQTALRTLREEGFVRSRTGSGVYVREQASLPAPGQQDHVLAGVAAFLFEMGHLKRVTRAGWLLLGIPQPETVAEHCFRAGAVGIALAALEGADIGRTAALCLLHDSHQTRTGDVLSAARAYVTAAVPAAVTAPDISHAQRHGQDLPGSRRRVRGWPDPGIAACPRCRRDRNPAPGRRVPGPRARHRAMARDIDRRPTHRLGTAARPGNRLSQPPQLVVSLHRLLPRTARQRTRANPGPLTGHHISHTRDGKVTEFWAPTTGPQASTDYWS